MPSGQIPSTKRVYVDAHRSALKNTLEEVDSVIVHPKFVSTSYYDIGLLRLKTEIEYNEEVAPVCLSHAPRSSSSLCFTTGYGDRLGRYLTIVDIMN